MTVEIVNTPADLNVAWPKPEDLLSEGDDHIRNTKFLLYTFFRYLTTPITTLAATAINKLGITAAPGTSNTDPASTAFVAAAILAASITPASATPDYIYFAQGIR